MKERDKTRLEILAQDMGVAGVLEALAEYCDRSADLMAEANEGKLPAPLEIELRAWSKRIWGVLKDRAGKKA
jgi:flagellar biosynthesis regulator FlaF